MTHRQTAQDVELKRSVVAELAWTLGVDGTTIGVGVTDGAVTLSGEVATYPEKLRAEKAAQRVAGVHGIAQEMTVSSRYGTRNDTDIARDAAHALESAVDVESGSVHAMVKDKIVTLTGTVGRSGQKEAAGRSVRHLKGVEDVRNLVVIRPIVSSGDIARSIEQALVRAARIDAHTCRVSATTTGEVTVVGTVSSWSERQQVDRVAWSAPGVTAVRNRLVVADPDRSDG